MSPGRPHRRKITFRIYPSKAQERTFVAWLGLHCDLYNAAIQERADAYRKFGISISYIDQQNRLPALKKDLPELAELGSQPLQETLRRVDRAFKAFFERAKSGQTPGCPRFKSKKRFNSFCFPAQPGWDAVECEAFSLDPERLGEAAMSQRKHMIRVGDMWIRARGMGRFPGYERNDLTIMRKAGQWFASMTVRVGADECARERKGYGIRGFDQGLTDRLVFDDGEKVPNDRWLSHCLDDLAELQQAKAKCESGSRRYGMLGKKIRELHGGVARRRMDAMHKLSADMVSQCELLASEEMDVAPMVKRPAKIEEKDASGKPTGRFLPNGAESKSRLSRENLSAGYSMLLGMLGYKAEEAGCRFVLCDTKKAKPTQRCAACGRVVKKELGQREHICLCGFKTTRDRNSALICLVDALWPDHYARLERGKPPMPDGYASLVRGRLEAAQIDAETKQTRAAARGPETVLEPDMEAILF